MFPFFSSPISLSPLRLLYSSLCAGDAAQGFPVPLGLLRFVLVHFFKEDFFLLHRPRTFFPFLWTPPGHNFERFVPSFSRLLPPLLPPSVRSLILSLYVQSSRDPQLFFSADWETAFPTTSSSRPFPPL